MNAVRIGSVPTGRRYQAPAGTGQLDSRQQGQVVMAHKTVQFIIGQILTDEELREKFLDQPFETLAALRDRGFDLTRSEIEALLLTDPRLWRAGPRWVDSRLQRCCLDWSKRSEQH
jgi:hypothetical protein